MAKGRLAKQVQKVTSNKQKSNTQLH
jgi:hypothetical protein